MIKEAIILTSGRYQTLGGKELPVSMLRFNDKYLLEYQLNYLDFYGVNHVIIAVGDDKEMIHEFFGNNYKSIQIEYCENSHLLGTGGALKKAFESVMGHTVFALSGDLFFDVNLTRFEDFRRIREAAICIATRFIDSTTRLGSVVVNEQNRVTGFSDNEDPFSDDFMNGGFYCIKSAYFMNKNTPEVFSFEKEFLEENYKSDPFYGYRCYSTFLDLATSIDCKRAANEFSKLPYR
ncbi:MAG: hypothetical protein KKG99_03175 [Bacteroidetes bacterium]|nr:hypothetical protein [Bacteroidota bacterium]